MVKATAVALGDLRPSVVFVGGSAVPLLITDPGAGTERPTDDVDVVVEATTRAEYWEIERQLRQR